MAENQKIEILMLKRQVEQKTQEGNAFVNPEELICELFAAILSDKVSLRVSTCSEKMIDESDRLMG